LILKKHGSSLQRFSARSMSAFFIFAVLALGIATQAQTPAKNQGSSKTQAHKATAPDPAIAAAPVKTLGNKNAPITMEVFSDYQCPSCGNFYHNTLKQMINDYVAVGKVYYIHRDFPLPMHPHSYQAARWANAAAKIGKFQDVEAAIFDNQAAWAADGNIEKYVEGALSETNFKRVQNLVTSCENNPIPGLAPTSAEPADNGCSLDKYIEQDKVLANQVPVTQTPTTVITYKGQKYPAMPGFVTWPILKQYLDSLLSQ
jgi:protein-disulfide isomerase